MKYLILRKKLQGFITHQGNMPNPQVKLQKGDLQAFKTINEYH